MIRCAIIGLGNIGFLYDYKNIKKNIVFSHTKAIIKNKNFYLTAVVERKKSIIKKFKRKYSIPVYNSIKSLFLNETIDLIVISVETNKHFDFFKKIIAQNIKAIIIEKPLSHSINHSKEILKISRQKKIPTYVNFQRSLEPGFKILKKNLDNSKYGNIQKSYFYYSKDIKEYGCHALDLILFLFGKPRTYSFIDIHKEDFLFKYKNYNTYLLKSNTEELSLIIITDKYSITFSDNQKIKIYNNNDKKKKTTTINTFSKSNIKFLYEVIYSNLKKGFTNNMDNLDVAFFNHKITNKLTNENK
tara:strand:- start:4471 stop:5373 length:903 start_codon:yes stop_codon:yes gene_type:complete